jgi:hypothetical protein
MTICPLFTTTPPHVHNTEIDDITDLALDCTSSTELSHLNLAIYGATTEVTFV